MNFRIGLLLIQPILCIGILVSAQKPEIQLDSYKTWPGIQWAATSQDGKYLMFTIENDPPGSHTLVIENSSGTWARKFIGGYSGGTFFLNDNRCIVRSGDSLCFLNLGEDHVEYLTGVSNFKIDGRKDRKCLAYQLNTSPRNLILFDLKDKSSRSFPGITSYEFTPDGEGLLMRKEQNEKDHKGIVLRRLRLDNYDTTTIWTGEIAGGFIFDLSGQQVAFNAQKNADGPHGIWYFRESLDTCTLLIDGHDSGLPPGYEINNSWISFHNNGDYLLFTLKPLAKPVDGSNPKVDIWSQTDNKLQSLQLKELTQTDNDWMTYSYGIGSGKTLPLTKQNERAIPVARDDSSGFILVSSNTGDYNEWTWNKKNRSSIYLVSIKDGSRRLLPDKATFNGFAISPAGRYVIYYDSEDGNYYSFETATGLYRNITMGIHTTWTSKFEWPGDKYFPFFLLAWTGRDGSMIIADQYDLWQIDPGAKRRPICLTNGFGKKNNIEFRIVNSLFDGNRKGDCGEILLQADDKATKQNGFYSAALGRQENPKKLTMGPFKYNLELTGTPWPGLHGPDTLFYLVTRMSATEAPNYYLTSDFIHFSPVSDIEPQKKYNWMTTELVSWKSFDGHTSQGILLKPENFDPQRKYPIIFNFYEQLSNELNTYTAPKSNGYSMNVDYMVSNGYLVFEPDIHFATGYPGRSAYNYVVSAAKHLGRMPWVDSTRMAIDGHSFGGFEVNYLVAHTHIFAAAVSGSGMSDFISAYGSIIGDGSSRQRQYEVFRDRIGATLWQRPDLYIENSAVLRADKITTPLFLMSNKADGDVPFAQGVELFTALRRLEKPVWMVQYDNDGHVLSNKINIDDYSLRVAQFFDHFLKNKPAPVWLSTGVPARLKGIDTGLEFKNDNK